MLSSHASTFSPFPLACFTMCCYLAASFDVSCGHILLQLCPRSRAEDTRKGDCVVATLLRLRFVCVTTSGGIVVRGSDGIRWDQSVGPRVLQAEADVLDLCETACDVAADFLGLSDDQADIC